MTKEQMNAIWRKPGVAQAGHLTLWYAIDHHKRGALACDVATFTFDIGE